MSDEEIDRHLSRHLRKKSFADAGAWTRAVVIISGAIGANFFNSGTPSAIVTQVKDLAVEVRRVGRQVDAVTTSLAVLQKGNEMDAVRDERLADHESRLRMVEIKR